MRCFLVILIVSIFATGCSKAKEEVIENQIMSYIANTHWQMVSFKRGPFDITADFKGYHFDFRDNKTVHAVKNNITEAVGVWDGNVGTQSIYAEFSNAAHPLPLLNATWVISDASPDYVVASARINGEVRTMRMHKL